jgi:hypothetical protein
LENSQLTSIMNEVEIGVTHVDDSDTVCIHIKRRDANYHQAFHYNYVTGYINWCSAFQLNQPNRTARDYHHAIEMMTDYIIMGVTKYAGA